MGRQDPASRRVSNLTDSQVERKRAIDRANQQHCQRRKKARLQWLEQEVVRLSESLEAAEAKLRQFDGCVCGAASGIRQTAGNLSPASLDLPGMAATNPDTTAVGLPISAAAEAGTAALPAVAVAHHYRNNTTTTVGGLTRTDVLSELDPPAHTDSIWTVNLRELLDPNHDSELGNIVFDYPMPSTDDDLTPSPIPLVDGSGTGSIPASLTTTVPEWQIVPLHLPPGNDLDRFIFDTTNSGRRLQQQLGGAGELSQAEFPSISSLLNPNLGDDGTKPLTFALATHVVRKSNVRSVTTRIALMYTLSHLLRWLVCRNKQSYEKLPEFLRPTQLQRTVPHPPWVDIITWPEARDAIIRSERWMNKDFEFSEFRVKTGADMSVNWPYTDSGAFLDLGDGQNLVLSPIFENHIRRVENWTLNKTTATEFPFMRAFCKDLEGEP
ncbi:hypothetical protein SCUCBS95973_008233 [Sporothrix curviconia]|uniref:BZIP domain-containing protein n=1 Tax=Sporothrix curviconia TaxID=1260050 RepID=A0ABP0CK76_9PEZI